MRMRISKKSLLLASVSSLAIAVSVPAVMAADMPARAPMYTKAPALAPVNPWTVYLEGGLQGLAGGDTNVAGFNPAFATPAQKWGWSGAVGLDYRLSGPWHASVGFRYGQNKTRTSSNSPSGVFNIGSGSSVSSTAVVGTNTATRKEYNWAADFMVGRDIGLGIGNSQLKFGLRVAEIRAKTEGTATFISASSPTVAHVSAYTQTNKFLGAGPRLALEGNAPLVGAWSIDYMGGVAGLYGYRQVDQTVINTGTPCLSGCPVASNSSSDGMVFNTDAMLGLAYQVAVNAKISLNYRVDAYFNALRVIDTNNNATNTNRIYHGPNLRMTLQY